MLAKVGVLSAFLLALAACSSDPYEANDDPNAQSDELKGCATPKVERKVNVDKRRPALDSIRRIAAEEGLHNALLVAGIGAHETGLTQCWKDAREYCQGPYSATCGGPVVAGSWDGPCSSRQGGLGMFQFDAGNYDESLRAYGKDILSDTGNIRAAVRLIVSKLKTCPIGPHTESDEATRAWLDRVRVGSPEYAVYLDAMARCYNGASEKTCRFQQVRTSYEAAIQFLLDDAGAAYWYAN